MKRKKLILTSIAVAVVSLSAAIGIVKSNRSNENSYFVDTPHDGYDFSPKNEITIIYKTTSETSEKIGEIRKKPGYMKIYGIESVKDKDDNKITWVKVKIPYTEDEYGYAKYSEFYQIKY